jgi:hypothetical protein
MPYPNPASTEKTSGIVSRTLHRLLGLVVFPVGVTVAIGTECDQIFLFVVTQQASRALVMDLKTIGTAAVLASPAITLQHLGTEFAIRICVEPKSRSSRLEITH